MWMVYAEHNLHIGKLLSSCETPPISSENDTGTGWYCRPAPNSQPGPRRGRAGRPTDRAADLNSNSCPHLKSSPFYLLGSTARVFWSDSTKACMQFSGRRRLCRRELVVATAGGGCVVCGAPTACLCDGGVASSATRRSVLLSRRGRHLALPGLLSSLLRLVIHQS